MMKTIPLIQTNLFKKQSQIADLFERLNTDKEKTSTVYILDKKGVEKNQPSLSLHQYTHRWFDTIVDAGCHHVGDVVDVLLAGADIIVLRPFLWREPDFHSIRDISETKIYLWADLSHNIDSLVGSSLFSDADGLILYADQLSSPLPFSVRDQIKTVSASFDADNILVFDPSKKHEKELGLFGLNSLIINVDELVDVYE